MTRSSGVRGVNTDVLVTTTQRLMRAAYRREGTLEPFAVLLISRNRITGAPLKHPSLFVLRLEEQSELSTLSVLDEKARELGALAIGLAKGRTLDGVEVASLIVDTPQSRTAWVADMLDDSLGPFHSVDGERFGVSPLLPRGVPSSKFGG